MKKRRKKKGSFNGSSGWKRSLKVAIGVPLAILRFLYKVLSRYPRPAAIAFFAIVLILVTSSFISKMNHFQIHQLPDTISVISPDETLRVRVHSAAKSAIEEAKRAHLTRPALLELIETRLSSLENLDTSVIRAGLDRRLQIEATPHIPLFVIETQDNQKFIITKRMTILGKISQAEIRDLPLISLPEVKVSGRSAGTRDKEKAGRRLPPLNFPWLYRTLIEAKSGLQSIPLGNLTLDRLQWKSGGGFSLKFRRTPSTSVSPTESEEVGSSTNAQVATSLTVILGEQDISKKIDKLSQLIRDFSQKNLMPEFVDLNFPDKAIIRMRLSEGGNGPTL